MKNLYRRLNIDNSDVNRICSGGGGGGGGSGEEEASRGMCYVCCSHTGCVHQPRDARSTQFEVRQHCTSLLPLLLPLLLMPMLMHIMKPSRACRLIM